VATLCEGGSEESAHVFWRRSGGGGDGPLCITPPSAQPLPPPRPPAGQVRWVLGHRVGGRERARGAGGRRGRAY
jgi:hypothetical protein